MIQEFSITNCLSIKEKATISFLASRNMKDEDYHVTTINNTKLLKASVIYGANASGKSNILHALNLFTDFIFYAYTELDPEEEIDIIPFLFDSETKNADSTFEIIFFFKEKKYVYSISLNSNKVTAEKLSYYPKEQAKLIFQRSDLSIKFGDMITGNKKDISNRTRPNSSFLNVASQFNMEKISEIYSALRKMLPNIIPSTNKGLLEYSTRKIEKSDFIKQEVLEVLKHADFSHISNIAFKKEDIPDELFDSLPDEIKEKFLLKKIKPQRTETFLEHNYKHPALLPLGLESSGTRRILALSVPLIQLCMQSQLQAIDELETSLHPEIVEFFINTFLQNTKENNINSQLLFTTHNTDLLENSLFRDDEIWFVEKNEDGASIFSRISDYTGVRKGVSRKTMYEAGRFGAKPMITDLHFSVNQELENEEVN